VLDPADRAIAGISWRDYGQVIVCDTYEEMVAEPTARSEHVQVMTRNPDYFLKQHDQLRRLFLGPAPTSATATRSSAPTTRCRRGAARYTGGLWVGKFIKTCTYQRVLTDEASVRVGEVCSRLCGYEHMSGHKEQADIRVRRLKKA
jgi:sulfopropanediol 3-dehydrogenase